MNIFVLDTDLERCVKYHLNKHVVKMCVEYSQLLCSVHHMIDSPYDIPYKLSNKNHPCSIWARECLENYVWLCDLGLELCKEYTYRYGKRHKSQDVIEWCMINHPKIESKGRLTNFALVMPDDCKVGGVVDSYREYYRKHKRDIAIWKNREVPYWYGDNDKNK